MKTILSLLCFSLISFTSFGQKVTYKDLIGTWIKDSAEGSNFVTYYFTDSSQVYISGERGYRKGTYKLIDSVGNIILSIECLQSPLSKYTHSLKSFIELNKDTMLLRTYEPAVFPAETYRHILKTPVYPNSTNH